MFDIEPTPVHVESWTEEMGGGSFGSMEIELMDAYLDYANFSATGAIEEACDYEDPDNMKASEGSKEARRASMGSKEARRASLSSVNPVTPRKIISSAA